MTPSGAPNFLRGTVNITSTSADTGSGVASSVLLAGGVGACAAGLGIPAAWITTGVADGTYDICNVVTDVATHTATATATVVVDNTVPTGSVVAPAAGAVVAGATVGLSTDAVDATAGIRNVQWRWAVGAGAQHNIGAPVAVATGGWARVWNTSTVAVAQRPPDGAVTISALVTDMAGNVLTITTPAVVDNTAPDVKAVLTAPPAVAGSPTLIWTPAHDAVGITRYEVLRGGNVITTVASIAGAQTFSYSDKSAPDQATSTYIVRAWDGAAHSVDSNAVPVLVDSTAVTAAKGLTAPTPTSAAPVLTWSAPSSFAVNHYDVYRDGLLIGSTPGAGATFTDATATEGTHDYAVLARDAASKPGVLSASFKVVFDRTAPTSGGAPTAQVLASGQVNLVWPAAGDALSGVAGYAVRRTGGGVAPAAADGGTAVCAPAQPGCSDASAATGTWSYAVFARDAAGNVALIGTVSNVVVVDKTPPLAPTKLTVTRPKGKSKAKSITLTLHWVKPTAADLDRMVVVLNLKRAPVGPADGKAVYHGLGTSAKVKLLPGQVGYFAVYAYDHSGNYSHSPLRKKAVRGLLNGERAIAARDHPPALTAQSPPEPAEPPPSDAVPTASEAAAAAVTARLQAMLPEAEFDIAGADRPAGPRRRRTRKRRATSTYSRRPSRRRKPNRRLGSQPAPFAPVKWQAQTESNKARAGRRRIGVALTVLLALIGVALFAAAVRWGLVPRWAKDLKVGYRMINAKAENLTSSRAARRWSASSAIAA